MCEMARTPNKVKAGLIDIAPTTLNSSRIRYIIEVLIKRKVQY